MTVSEVTTDGGASADTGGSGQVVTVRVEAASGTTAVGLADADAAFAVAWIAGLLQRARAMDDAPNSPLRGPPLSRYAASDASSGTTLWRSVSSADLDNDDGTFKGEEEGAEEGVVAGDINDRLFYDAEAVWRALAPAARLACRRAVRAYRNYTGSEGDKAEEVEEAAVAVLNTEQAAARLLAVLAAELGLSGSGVGREVAAVARLALMSAAGRYYGRRALRRRHLRAAVSRLRHHLKVLVAPAPEPYDAVLLWTDSPGLSAALAHQRQRRAPGAAPTPDATAAPMLAFARCLLDAVREEVWHGAHHRPGDAALASPPPADDAPAKTPVASPSQSAFVSTSSPSYAAAALPLLVAEAPLRALALSLGAVDAAAASLSSLSGASADVAHALFGSPAPKQTRTSSAPASATPVSASPQSEGSPDCPIASLVVGDQAAAPSTPAAAATAPQWAVLPPSALAHGAALLAGGDPRAGPALDVACFGGVVVAAAGAPATDAAPSRLFRVFDVPTPPRALGVCVERHRPDGATDRSSVVWLGPPHADAYHLVLLVGGSGAGAGAGGGRVDVEVLACSAGAAPAPALFWSGDEIMRAEPSPTAASDIEAGQWVSLGVCVLGGARHEGDCRLSVAVVERPAVAAEDGGKAGADGAPQLLLVLPVPPASAPDGGLPPAGLDLRLSLASGGQAVPMARLRPRLLKPTPSAAVDASPAAAPVAAHDAALARPVATSMAAAGGRPVGGPWVALGLALRVAAKLGLYAALLLLPWALPATVLFLSRIRAPPALPTALLESYPHTNASAAISVGDGLLAAAPLAAEADPEPSIEVAVTNATDALPVPFPVFPIRMTIVAKTRLQAP